MKIAITVNGSYAQKNQFDYKISFLLNKGYELINSNRCNDTASEISAIMVGELEDDVDVELYRRLLYVEMNKSLSKERFRYEKIDKLTGGLYLHAEEFDKVERKMREELKEEIEIFFNKNKKFLSLIKPVKRNSYYSINEILRFEDMKRMDALVDDDKIPEAKELLKKSMWVKNYSRDNLLRIPGF